VTAAPASPAPLPLPASQLPEPGFLWIRYTPRSGRGAPGWPGPPGPWLDLAGGGLAGWETGAAALPPLDPSPLDDVLYLPPVRPELAARRDELARLHLARGTPVLVQLLPGEAPPPEPAVAVYDLLPVLIAGAVPGGPEGARSATSGLETLPDLPAGAAAVWPLLPGIGEDEELWEAVCTRLAAAGAQVVQAVRPRLAPADRRRLAELGGAASYSAVFHRDAPEPRAFAHRAHRHALAPFLPRPLPRPPILLRENRRLAGLLALAGELWLRLGRPAEAGHGLFRAAREADRASWDLAALERDGNLTVLGWLGEEGRRLVEEALEAGPEGPPPRLLEELMGEYLEQG
jgi:hypothetical protein